MVRMFALVSYMQQRVTDDSIMVHFYRFPLEIREMVYYECVVVGEIYPYSISDARQPDAETAREKTGCDLPAMALMQVSKTIRREAEPMLYQQNVIRLGSATATKKFFERCLTTPERRMWLKSIRLSLNCQDITRTDRAAILDTQLSLERDSLLFPENTPYRWFEAKLHAEYRKRLTEVIWPCKVSPIIEDCKLEKLAIDFNASTCQAGCCRLRAPASIAFRKGFAQGMPKEIQAIGLTKEKTELLRKLIKKWTSWRVARCDMLNALDVFPEESER